MHRWDSADDVLDLLSRRFRPDVIQQRKIGGRQVSYVPVAAVIERLNKATNTWNFRIVSRERETMILNRWNSDTLDAPTLRHLPRPSIGLDRAILDDWHRLW